jgi:hypothetical protein
MINTKITTFVDSKMINTNITTSLIKKKFLFRRNSFLIINIKENKIKEHDRRQSFLVINSFNE